MDSVNEDTALREGNAVNSTVAPKSSISYSCKICGKTFPFNFHLQRHIISHHQTDKHSPKRTFPQDEASATPKRICSRQSATSSQCEFCGKRFNFPLFLQQHIASVHPHGPRKSDTRRALQSGVTHDCEQCGKSFTFKSQLRDHIVTTHGEEFVPVPFVTEPIASPVKEKRTPLYKSSEENTCETCGKTFSSIYNLQRHLKNIHDIDCVLIRSGEYWNRKSHLEKSSMGVSAPVSSTKASNSVPDVITYECGHCDKVFVFSSSLHDHMASAHSTEQDKRIGDPEHDTSLNNIDEGRFCEACSKPFSSHFNLIRHMRNIHHVDAVLDSSTATKVINILGPLPSLETTSAAKPESVVTYACEQCDKVFFSNVTLNDHITCEHTKENHMIMANPVVQMEMSVADENNTTPFFKKTAGGTTCELCDRTFCSYFSRRRHLINVHHVTNVQSLYRTKSRISQDHSESVKAPDNEHGSKLSASESQGEDDIVNTTELSTKTASPEARAEITTTSLGVEVETPVPQKVVKNSCAICSNAFSSYQNLLRHLRNIHHVNFVGSHPGKKTTSTRAHSDGGADGASKNCVQCGRVFDSNGQLRDHILSVHTTKLNKDEKARSPVVTKSERFPCHVCDVTFCSFHNLLRHLRNIHKVIGVRDRSTYAKLTNTAPAQKPPTLFSCRFCDKQFKLNFILRRHVASAHPDVPLIPENLDPNASHSGPMRLACDLCGETFKLNFHLRRHIATAHASAHFCLAPGRKKVLHKTPQKAASPQCAQCGKKFKLNIQLRQHLKSEHNEPPDKHGALEKDLAGVNGDKVSDFDSDAGVVNKEKDDNYSPSAKRQMSIKSTATKAAKVKRAKCKYCGARFKLNIQLRRHIRIKHPSERPLCEPCGKRFSSHICYVRHINTVHRNKKPAICEVCGKHFSQKFNLKVHMQIHTRRGDPPMCDTCGKTFSSEICYQRHLKTMHTKRNPVFCDVCGKAFTQKYNLKVHMESHNRHLIRIIEEGDEVELPEPPASEIDLDMSAGHKQLIGKNDLETVEAITLELPASSGANSSDDDDDEGEDGPADDDDDEEEEEEEDEGNPEKTKSSHPTVNRRSERENEQLARWRRKEFYRKMMTIKKRKQKEKGKFLMSPITNWMVEQEPGMAVVRRQHPVFMRKAIDLSKPAADHAKDHRATAAVYTTYMLA